LTEVIISYKVSNVNTKYQKGNTMWAYLDPFIDIAWAIIRGGITGVIIALVFAHYMKKYLDDMEDEKQTIWHFVNVNQERISSLQKEVELLKCEIITLKQHDKWCTMYYEDRFLVKAELTEEEKNIMKDK
jgi:hypothetical protein